MSKGTCGLPQLLASGVIAICQIVVLNQDQAGVPTKQQMIVLAHRFVGSTPQSIGSHYFGTIENQHKIVGVYVKVKHLTL